MKNDKLLNPKGHLTDEAVYLYTDALKLEKTSELPGEVRDHVQECLQCKVAIQEIYDLVRDQDYDSLRPHPYFDQKKIHTKRSRSIITRLAAAIVIGVGLAFLAYFYFPYSDMPVAIDEPIEEPTEIIPDEVEPAPPDITEPEDIPAAPQEPRIPADLFAANFEQSPFYEILVDQQFRSHAIRVETPEIAEEITDDIFFSWKSRVPITVHLQLLDNTENVIWSTTTDEQSVTFSSDLEPGIYYWRLETDEELLYVGKFIIPIR